MRKNFVAKDYIALKKQAIKRFCDENKIGTIVLGVSGGIDSAVVFSLYQSIVKDNDSYLKRVVPVVAPISNTESVSGQREATKDAIVLLSQMGLSLEDIFMKELEPTFKSLRVSSGSVWSDGQMASVLRTPLMYYVASIYFEKFNENAIVSGTTNLSEGGYIGFYGKGSDGMNDIQPIADILKSEVYEVAKELGISDYFIQRIPKGDVLGGLTDQELMNGVTYDELEEFMCHKLYDKYIDRELEYPKKIEALHSANRHKYRVGLPAHVLNVIPVFIHDGWNYNVYYSDISITNLKYERKTKAANEVNFLIKRKEKAYELCDAIKKLNSRASFSLDTFGNPKDIISIGMQVKNANELSKAINFFENLKIENIEYDDIGYHFDNNYNFNFKFTQLC